MITFPQPLIAIVGDSGTGKSTSLRNLDWTKTLFIDNECKGLPFDYSKMGENYIAAKTTTEVARAIINVKKNKAIRYVVLDSITKFFEHNLAECSVAYKGYDIYKAYSAGVRDLLNSLRSTDQIFIVTGIPETLKISSESGGETTARRLFVHGKEWEGKVEKEFLCVFFTSVKKAPAPATGMTYNFITNTDGICSAKTPMGWFANQIIPNDVAEVLKVIDKNNTQKITS